MKLIRPFHRIVRLNKNSDATPRRTTLTFVVVVDDDDEDAAVVAVSRFPSSQTISVPRRRHRPLQPFHRLPLSSFQTEPQPNRKLIQRPSLISEFKSDQTDSPVYLVLCS